MNYKIIPSEYFKQQVRELMKVYPGIRRDLKELSVMLKENSKAGKPLGKKVYNYFKKGRYHLKIHYFELYLPMFFK